MEEEKTEEVPEVMPAIPEYRVSLPEDPRMEECEQDLAAASTMKDLRAIARKWKVKGYKKFRAVNKDALRDHIRTGVGMLIGLDMFKERMASLTPEELEAMKQASDAPVSSQRKELMEHRPIEPEVLPAAPSEVLPEEIYEAALEEFAEKHDKALFRVCDVLPTFLRTLRDQEFKQSVWVEFSGGPRADQAVSVLGDKLKPEDPWWGSEDASEMMQEVFELLGDVAPAGFYFGLDMGDMERGFGFWKEKVASAAEIEKT